MLWQRHHARTEPCSQALRVFTEPCAALECSAYRDIYSRGAKLKVLDLHACGQLTNTVLLDCLLFPAAILNCHSRALTDAW